MRPGIIVLKWPSLIINSRYEVAAPKVLGVLYLGCLRLAKVGNELLNLRGCSTRRRFRWVAQLFSNRSRWIQSPARISLKNNALLILINRAFSKSAL